MNCTPIVYTKQLFYGGLQMEEKILEILKDNTLKAGEISEKLGIDKKDVDKIIKKLKESDKIFSPKKCYYSAK